MSHIVIHDDSSNVTHYAEFDDVQAAASYLEGLVTEDDGSNARLFALDPVEFAVKSYVRVEIGEAGDAAPAPASEPASEAPASVDAETTASETTASDAAVTEVFTDAPADDTVEYVEAAMAPVDVFAPTASTPEHAEDPDTGEVRRGLFGR